MQDYTQHAYLDMCRPPNCLLPGQPVCLDEVRGVAGLAILDARGMQQAIAIKPVGQTHKTTRCHIKWICMTIYDVVLL